MSASSATSTVPAIDSLIGGKPVVPADERRQQIVSPVDGRALGAVALADAAVLDQAVATAREAAKAWGARTIKDRVQVLFRFKQLCEERKQAIGEVVTAENGKTVAESIAGLEKGLEVVEYATALQQLMTGEVLEVSRGVDCHTRRFPLGVVAGITPFNFPAMVPLWMIPMALACGNAFILKPSEKVPMTANLIAELLAEAGLPEGVFTVVHGDRATVEGICDHPGIDAVSFVGSTPVAKAVHARATASGKRVLALGGAKNHLVVVPDADPDLTAANVVASACGCAGQRCMAASALVAVGDCDAIVERIAEIARGITTGSDMGAVISREAKERIEAYITRAEQSGAKILVDGRGVEVPGKEGGTYVGPTIIDRLPVGHEALTDEIFGPVLAITRVATLDEALAIENASPFGNAASIFTTSGAVARAFEMRASAGMIGVNVGVPVPREPFSFGGWNESKFGIGDITGRDGYRFWTKEKKVTVKWSATAATNWMS